MPAAVAAGTSTLVGSPRAEPMATIGRWRTGPATTSPSHTTIVAPSASMRSASASAP
jgi:hypothetical protein